MQKCGGRLLVRFDDTNPSKEKGEYADNILKDLRLRVDVEADKRWVCYFESYFDHFDKIKKEALELIKESKAFMDDTPQEQMKTEPRVEYRSTGTTTRRESQEFQGHGRHGAAVVFAGEDDMSSDNSTLRIRLHRANAARITGRVRSTRRILPTT